MYEVTIGIPVYNVEKYIRQTLDSALAQTFPSIEFLICDDCGSDSSIEIIQEIRDNHPRGKDIRILHQPNNMGVSAARNRIIGEARGYMLYFMDSDDLIEPFTIAKLVEEQKQNDADIVFGSYDKIAVYNDNHIEDVIQYTRSIFLEEDQLATFSYSKYGAMQASACNYLVKVKLLRDIGLRFIDINFWEDMAFTYELVTYCHRAVLLPDVTYHYMCRLNSLSNYQKREIIQKKEILRNLKAVNYLREKSDKLRLKSYYPLRCYIVMKTYFYVYRNIVQNAPKITPPFSNKELKAIVKHPATFFEILKFRKAKFKNLLLYCWGSMPVLITKLLIKLYYNMIFLSKNKTY